ncbi:hypothetical protein SASPL_117540 [Salvia splendens]|uniref:Metalloenzyme domain-containing protein n=1 Tax=Salvia splendens TaxID=180675 RepID=A0A8X8XXR3_SALSN|nr:hypothetical protein SASPL_117540 [Salvia splendens]
MVNSKEPKRRVAFILVDGVGDVSLPKFGFKTPMQVANVPNLDAIASAGINGLMDPVEVGLGCGSDTAHLSLLGYDLRIYYRGRGAFESMGIGLAMALGDIAFKVRTIFSAVTMLKSNLATLDESSGVVTSRGQTGILKKKDLFFVQHWMDSSCLLFLNMKLESGMPWSIVKQRIRLQLLMSYRKKYPAFLVGHPVNARRVAEGKNIANVVLLRGCGIRIEVPPFEKIHGLRPCMVAPTKIIAGLGLSLGIDILGAPGATGDYRTLLTSKADAIARALSAPSKSCPNVFVPGEDEHKPGRPNGYDFGFLHIKAIDDAGHDKASVFKAKGLEAVDKAIGQLTKLLWQAEAAGEFQYYICVTGVHSTPVEYGDHSFEPVPFTLCRLKDFIGAVGGDSHLSNIPLDPFPLPTVESGGDLAHADRSQEEKQGLAFNGDKVFEFNEIAAARGILGRFTGSEMMGIIKAHLKLS